MNGYVAKVKQVGRWRYAIKLGWVDDPYPGKTYYSFGAKRADRKARRLIARREKRVQVSAVRAEKSWTVGARLEPDLFRDAGETTTEAENRSTS